MSYCAKNNCVTTNHNRYAGSGGAMLRKKYANKFNKVSSNKQFSINGSTNHSYIGNPNSIISQDPFSSVLENSSYGVKKINVSVKSSKGYLNSKCSANNSAACYKNNNSALLDISGSLNKHLRGENRVQSLYISNLKSKCSLITDYATDKIINLTKKNCNSICDNKINRNLSSSSRIERLIHYNNIVKNSSFFNGFTPDYSLYYNDSSLYKKIAACNLHNPPDAKVIAC
jgi:spore coat protein CotH